MRLLRPLGILLAAALALTLLAAWLVPPLLDWDAYRGTVAAIASAGLGRPVRIDGPIRLSLLPRAELHAGNVVLASTGDGASATVAEMRLRVALGPLIAGRVEPLELVLHRPAMRLPWPLAAFTLRGAPAGLHARVESGTLTIGALAITGIDGDLAVDPAAGTLSATGLATAMGRSWRMTGRLGRTGADGSATIAVSLDGQGPMVDTGAALSGRIDADGGLAGRVSGRGPDLSLLLAAPPLPWRAEGQVTAGSGLMVADDLEITVGGVPARGAVALRLLPRLRLDAALATSRLDLDAWLPALLHGGRTALPTGIDLSADAASLSGGALRRLRAGLELADGGVALREADAVLPGDAALHLTGMLSAGQFTGQAQLTAPALPRTLAWVRPHAPALVDALPPGALRTAHLSATVRADAGRLALGGIQGDLDGAAVAGDLAVQGGARPALAANLQLAAPVLDPFVPDIPPSLAQLAKGWAAWPGRYAGLDADVTLVATHPVWQGSTLDRLDVSARCVGGTLQIRRASLAGPDGKASLSGSLAPGGAVSDGRLALSTTRAELFGTRLPAALDFARPLLRGDATLALKASGPPDAVSLSSTAELSDARLQLDGRADLADLRWQGGVSLRHPGAPRLLWSLGAGDVTPWLGEGSLSLQAGVDASSDRVALTGLQLSAGSMRAGGALALSGLAAGNPVVTGTLDADTLALPPLRPHSGDPFPLGLLRAGGARVAVHAAHVLAGLSPLLEDASARVSLADGALVVDAIAGRLAGGTLAGRVSLEAAAPPRFTAPRFAAAGTLSGAVLDGGLGGTPVDLVAGAMDATADVSGAGYSPAGVLATLAGPVRVTVRDGTLAGLDAGKALQALQQATPDPLVVADALRAGTMAFSRLDLAGTVANGTLTIGRGEIVAPAGAIGLSGSLDLPDDSIDARLALRPATDGAPTLGLNLIGPLANPSRTPELADLARWLAAR